MFQELTQIDKEILLTICCMVSLVFIVAGSVLCILVWGDKEIHG